MPGGSDSKYFATQKKGEVHELRNDLNSNSKDKIKEAVKKVIASMTVGKDVSSLFTDVIKCMHTQDIELKKLIYLYIINYARSQPEKAILVVAAFQRDATDKNPLIRALAIRTMGCIRVDRITQFLCDPLQASLQDPDPYVRKTAAICVAKLYDLNPELVEEQGFLISLSQMLTDNNHTVVANAVASLMEISQLSGRGDLIEWTTDLLSNLLVALNACTEWGQISILECLSTYIPTSSQQAEDVIDRVTPRLKHANAAVAMAAIKLILAYLPYITNEEVKAVLLKQKLPPPLITLLGDRRAEIQYVALRHVELIIQKYPTILTPHVKHFFCKYSDTSYVKVEKIDILVRLITVDNMDKVLLEFKEYACEADVDFVRKSIRAIGRCAIKLPECSKHAVAILLSLIENRVNYVVQESILVIKNIFRRYPEQYESIITTLCNHLDSLDDNEAKTAMIWIIGEYCHRIDNSHELLSLWCETFLDEQPNIQLQLLTSTVKLFLKQPDIGQDLVTTVLTLATKQVDSPDVRDRALIYWRLLSTDADLAIKIVFGEKPTIRDDTTEIDAGVLDQLLTNDFSTLACVYQKPSTTFVKDINKQLLQQQQEDYYYEDDHQQQQGGEEYTNQDDEVQNYQQAQQQQIQQPQQQQQQQQIQQQQPQMEIDLLGLTGLSSVPSPQYQQSQQQQQQQPQQQSSDLLDMFGLVTSTQQQVVAPQQQQQFQQQNNLPILISSDKGQGVEIRGRVIKNPSNTFQQPIALELHVINNSQQPITALPLKFNTNYYGVGPVGQPKCTIVSGSSTSSPIIVPLGFTSTALEINAKVHSGLVQIAVKLPTTVAYFSVEVPTGFLFENNDLLQQGQWLTKFGSLKDPQYLGKTVFQPAPHFNNPPAIVQALAQHGLQHLSTSSRGNDSHIFCSSRFRGVDVCVDVVLGSDGSISANCRHDDGSIAQLCSVALQGILQ